MTVFVRPLGPEDAMACDGIVASLPDFFGLEEGIRACAEAVRSEHGFVAVEDGSVRAFATFIRHFEESAEITWMATHAEHRRRGFGGALVEELATTLSAEGRRLLLVLTLSPNDPDDAEDGYAATRLFYQRQGFVLGRDLPELWEDNIAALMVGPLVDMQPSGR
jgi:ribosomal protein S18 acetylase RimI-like enzyme